MEYRYTITECSRVTCCSDSQFVVKVSSTSKFAVMYRAAVLLAVVQLSLAQQLVWPKQYTVSGQIILPYGDINEPFTATVDMTGKGRSRVDYYGGEDICKSIVI